MRLGESRDAAYRLRGPLPAGTWHLVGDGECILQAVTVRFDVVWRAAATSTETVVATATHAFAAMPPGPTQYDAVAFETDVAGVAAAAAPGDLLILRFSTVGGAATAGYTPNGDGALAHGRIPSLTLPSP